MHCSCESHVLLNNTFSALIAGRQGFTACIGGIHRGRFTSCMAALLTQPTVYFEQWLGPLKVAQGWNEVQSCAAAAWKRLHSMR